MTTIGSDHIDLARLWATIWSGRAFIAIVTVIVTLAGGVYAFLATEWYKAEVVLAPVNRQAIPGGGLAGMGVMGGLAALAGVSLPSSDDQHPVAVLKSKDFAKDFIEEFELMPVLLERVPGSSQPDIRDAVELFDKNVRVVTEDTRAGLVRLSMKWTDGETAAQWANAFAQRLNERLRRQAENAAERNIAYLVKEMGSTNIVSLQQSMGALLESEMQKLLLSRGNEEFSFRVIDKAIASKSAYSPKRALLIVVAFLGGIFISITLLMLVRAVRS